MEKIKIAINGYGNLGKGIEKEIAKSEDMELVAIFTRRDPRTINNSSNVPVISINEIENWKEKIDVLIRERDPTAKQHIVCRIIKRVETRTIEKR